MIIRPGNPSAPETLVFLWGTLDGDPGIRPTFHLFVDSKVPGFEIADQLPKFDTFPRRLLSAKTDHCQIRSSSADLFDKPPFVAAGGAFTLAEYGDRESLRIFSVCRYQRLGLSLRISRIKKQLGCGLGRPSPA